MITKRSLSGSNRAVGALLVLALSSLSTQARAGSCPKAMIGSNTPNTLAKWLADGCTLGPSSFSQNGTQAQIGAVTINTATGALATPGDVNAGSLTTGIASVASLTASGDVAATNVSATSVTAANVTASDANLGALEIGGALNFTFPGEVRDGVIAGTMMHELGHNFAIPHNDDFPALKVAVSDPAAGTERFLMIDENAAILYPDGSSLLKALTRMVPFSVSSIPGNGCIDSASVFEGAVDGDAVSLGVPSGLASINGLMFSGFVNAADSVTIRVCNMTVNPVSMLVSGNITVHLQKLVGP